ncbi:hypothetical protein D3C78_876900 [compost metagenome]
MSSVVEAKRAFYASLGIDLKAVSDMEAAYYEGVAGGTVSAAPVATATVPGTVLKAATVAAAAVPFADLTAAANAYNALRTSLINAGLMAAS